MTGDLGSFTSKHLRSRWYSLARTVICVSEWSGVMAVTSHVTKKPTFDFTPSDLTKLIYGWNTGPRLPPPPEEGGELVAVIFALGRTVFEIN